MSTKQRNLWNIRRKEAAWGFLFASPWFVGFCFFMLYPIVSLLYYSFCSYDVVSPATWVGFDNFRLLFFEDKLFWKSVYNTLYFTAVNVPILLMLALGIALLLNTGVRGLPIFRTIFYMPTVVPIVSLTILWVWLLNPQYGLVNSLLSYVGIVGPGWFASTAWAKPGIILLRLYMLGSTMIIFLAGLQNVPRRLYESAEIDGANSVVKFLYITLPMLTPTLFFNLIMNVINTFQVFTEVYITTGGGPAGSTNTLVLYLYTNAFSHFKMGYASAIVAILFLLIFACTIIIFSTGHRWVHYEQG